MALEILISIFTLFLFLVFLSFFGKLREKLGVLEEKVETQSKINLEQQRLIQEIKEKMSFTQELKERVEKTRDLIEDLKRFHDRVEAKREEKERELLERLKRVDEIVAGTSAKGVCGEEILRETFKKLPPEMIEKNFRVKGKVVEFALVLPNQKKIPIDSKWPASNLLLMLEQEKDQQKRKEIVAEIEKEVVKRVKEVSQYLDPNLTWSQAIAAVPDSVYAVCSEAHLRAREFDVILMPYSMVLPLVLYMYRLHLQYALSVDAENLKNHLISISKNLDEMENILENKISRAATMLSNAYLEYQQLISKLRSSVVGLQLKSQDHKQLRENHVSSD